MKTASTCATCKDNKCEVRSSCPDDETTLENRKEVLESYPEVNN